MRFIAFFKECIALLRFIAFFVPVQLAHSLLEKRFDSIPHLEILNNRYGVFVPFQIVPYKFTHMLFICSDVGNNWRSHYIHAYYDKHNQIHMERISPDKGTLRPNYDWMTEFVTMLQPNRWFSIRLTLICMWIYTSFSFLSRVAEGLNESWETKHWGIKCISQYIVSSAHCWK